MTFNPYNTSELIKIIETRLRSTGDYSGDGKYDAITQNAVQLASMKVAQISGDARRALELCRRGIEIAEARIERERESGELNCVSRCGPSDISKAQNEMFSATYMKMLKGLSKHERIFLAALLLRTRQLGYKEVYVSDVLEVPREAVHEPFCAIANGFRTTIVSPTFHAFGIGRPWIHASVAKGKLKHSTRASDVLSQRRYALCGHAVDKKCAVNTTYTTLLEFKLSALLLLVLTSFTLSMLARALPIVLSKANFVLFLRQ